LLDSKRERKSYSKGGDAREKGKGFGGEEKTGAEKRGEEPGIRFKSAGGVTLNRKVEFLDKGRSTARTGKGGTGSPKGEGS